MGLVFISTIFLALILMSAVTANKFKENIMDTFPVSTCVLILILYILAFFRGMKLIGVFAAFYIIVQTALLIREKKFKETAAILADPVFLSYFTVVMAIAVIISKTVLVWSDDINFWAGDAKQLYFLNGFAPKYGNVCPEYGDYPPVTSLFKWLFLQISYRRYSEGLQFSGYSVLIYILMMPLAGKVKKLNLFKNRFLSVLIGILFPITIILLPGVFSGLVCYATASDIPMGILYGILLLTIWEQNETGKFFYYAKIALYTSVLLLTKSVGIEWVLFALIFYLLFAKKQKELLISLAFSGCFFISWLLFCLINERTADLTQSSKNIIIEGYQLPAIAKDMFNSFTQAFWLRPMHANHNVALDPSTGLTVILLLIFVIFLGFKKFLDKKETIKLFSFMSVSALIGYGIILFAHISIFQAEDQYLNTYIMCHSISRYGCPISFGGAILLAGIMLDRLKDQKSLLFQRITVIVFMLLIWLTTDYGGLKEYLYKYKGHIAYYNGVFEDMMTDEGRVLIYRLSNEQYFGKRIIVFRDENREIMDYDSYLKKEVSPVSLVFDTYNADKDTYEILAEKIRESHAQYVYIAEKEAAEETAKELFEPLMDKNVQFQTEVVYCVDTDAGVVIKER